VKRKGDAVARGRGCCGVAGALLLLRAVVGRREEGGEEKRRWFCWSGLTMACSHLDKTNIYCLLDFNLSTASTVPYLRIASKIKLKNANKKRTVTVR
jgi:hypothetical protein